MTTLISLDTEQLEGIYELLVDWLQENTSLTISGASDEDFNKFSALQTIKRELKNRGSDKYRWS